MLGGRIAASAGEVIFYDPGKKLEEAQYQSCKSDPVNDQKWQEIVERLLDLENRFSLGFQRRNGHLTAEIDGKREDLLPEHFQWIRPKGELEGYH